MRENDVTPLNVKEIKIDVIKHKMTSEWRLLDCNRRPVLETVIMRCIDNKIYLLD